VAAPVLELVRRYARTHSPFTAQEAAQRFGLDLPAVEAALHKLVLDGRVVEGGFRPAGVHREWCDAEVLRQIRRKSLARLRKEIEPVEQQMLARLETHWQGVLQKRRGLDALLDTIENLQGAPLPASLVESAILPARLQKYSPADLDTLIAAGEVIWCGLDPLGEHDGRIGLYLADNAPALLPAHAPSLHDSNLSKTDLSEKERAILAELARSGAMFFAQLHEATGGGYPGESVDALWSLVWRGLVTNDTFHALRAYVTRPSSARPAKRQHNVPAFRSRRTTPPSAQGRWALVTRPDSPAASQADQPSATQRSHALALQLLNRYGIVTRETVSQENIPGGFSAVYDVLKALEESGRLRRGYFVTGLGAAQFALPSAVDLLRSLRNGAPPENPEIVTIAATDPANLYGSVLRWPQPAGEPDGSDPAARSLTRSVGASVILRNGELIAYMRRNNPNLQVFFPADEPDRTNAARDLAVFLATATQESMRRDETGRHSGLLLSTVNGVSVHEHWLARFLLDAGFQPAPMGFNVRRMPAAPAATEAAATEQAQ